MVGLHLLALVAAIAVLAPGSLVRPGWVYRSPRLGITAWYAVVAAVASGIAAAAVALVVPWRGGGAPVCVAWRWCVQAMAGEFGVAGWLASGVALIGGLGLVVRVIVCAMRLAYARATWRRQHLRTLGLVGRRWARLGVTVIDCARPAAYVLAGRHRRIVVTSGAIRALTDDELAAVVAHERAHAAGRHDLLVDGMRLLQLAFPHTRLFAVASAQLSRLVEIRADEVAVRVSRRISLARALVTVATAASALNVDGSVVPVGAVAAAGGDAAERLRRLLQPPHRLAPAQRFVAVAGIALVAVAPTGLLAAAQLFPVLAACPAVPW